MWICDLWAKLWDTLSQTISKTRAKFTSQKATQIKWFYWYDIEAHVLCGPYATEVDRDIAQTGTNKSKQLPGYYWFDIYDFPHGPFARIEDATTDEESWDGKMRPACWYDIDGAPHGSFETIEECVEIATKESELAEAIEEAVGM